MEATATKTNLLNFDRKGLEAFFVELGEPAFRGTQVMKWVHQVGMQEFDGMTNLSKNLRAKLSDVASIKIPTIVSEQISEDGTRKWLLRLECGNSIETVFIPEEDRGTLCVSSQVGCALNCSFCATAQQGFNRNLTVAEIIGQVWVVVRRLSEKEGMHDRHVTNVVLMGMGEPLLNFDNVLKATDIMMDDFAYGLSKRRVTLSTSGVVPAMKALREASSISLAVSLHAPNDELRNVLVPINKKYPVKELIEVCRTYFESEPHRRVTFEYVMLEDVNDSPKQAKELCDLLEGVPAMVNLIPFNPFLGAHYRRSDLATINRFRDVLMSAGIMVVTRKTRGDDIAAACGQLVGGVQDRTRRSSRRTQVNINEA